MTFMSRIKNTIAGKINKALDEIEDPMEQLELSIKKKEEAIKESKRLAASFIGSTSIMKLEIEKLQDKSRNYKKVAIVKAREGDEKEFIKWHEAEESANIQIDSKTKALNYAQIQSDKIILSISAMEKELVSIKNKKSELKARYGTAKALGSINETLAEIDKSGMPSISEIEKKVEAKESYANGLNIFIKQNEDDEIASILSKNTDSDKLTSDMEKYKEM